LPRRPSHGARTVFGLAQRTDHSWCGWWRGARRGRRRCGWPWAPVPVGDSHGDGGVCGQRRRHVRERPSRLGLGAALVRQGAGRPDGGAANAAAPGERPGDPTSRRHRTADSTSPAWVPGGRRGAACGTAGHATGDVTHRACAGGTAIQVPGRGAGRRRALLGGRRRHADDPGSAAVVLRGADGPSTSRGGALPCGRAAPCTAGMLRGAPLAPCFQMHGRKPRWLQRRQRLHLCGFRFHPPQSQQVRKRLTGINPADADAKGGRKGVTRASPARSRCEPTRARRTTHVRAGGCCSRGLMCDNGSNYNNDKTLCGRT